MIRLGNGPQGEITKSLATDTHGGVYIPTNQKLYRFVAGPGGAPVGSAGRSDIPTTASPSPVS